MNRFLLTTLTAFIIGAIGVFIVYNFVPLKYFEIGQSDRTFGSTITTILGTDRLSDSRAVINTNFSNLNSDKFESGSSGSLLTIASSTIGTFRFGTFTGTSTATSTLTGGISLAGLASSKGITIASGFGALTSLSTATSTLSGGLIISAGCLFINSACSLPNTVPWDLDTGTPLNGVYRVRSSTWNFLSNSSFESWLGGTSAVPDAWTLAGDATVSRSGTSAIGSYGAQIVFGTANTGELYQTIGIDTTVDYTYTCYAQRTSGTGDARLVAQRQDSPFTEFTSVALSETAGFQLAALTVKPSAGTQMRFAIKSSDTTASTWVVDECLFQESKAVATTWQPRFLDDMSTLTLFGSTTFANGFQVSTTTGTTTIMGGTKLSMATTTNLTISGTCFGCPMSYMASTTSFSVSATNNTYQIPTNANTGVGNYAVAGFTPNPSGNHSGQIIITRSGLTSTDVFQNEGSGSTDSAVYNFDWTGGTLTVTESTDTNANASISGTIYWYK